MVQSRQCTKSIADRLEIRVRIKKGEVNDMISDSDVQEAFAERDIAALSVKPHDQHPLTLDISSASAENIDRTRLCDYALSCLFRGRGRRI